MKQHEATSKSVGLVDLAIKNIFQEAIAVAAEVCAEKEADEFFVDPKIYFRFYRRCISEFVGPFAKYPYYNTEDALEMIERNLRELFHVADYPTAELSDA